MILVNKMYQKPHPQSGIACPHCGETVSYVTSSRYKPYGIKRRRECTGCNKRFSTIEHVVDFETVKEEPPCPKNS